MGHARAADSRARAARTAGLTVIEGTGRREPLTLPPRDSRRVAENRIGLVDRPRLVTRLTESADAPLVLIAAPAGYGKTTLAVQWQQSDPRVFPWLALDQDDNDPERIGARIEHAISASLSKEEPFVLVLDDVHALRSPRAFDVVRRLVDRLPRGSQLALLSRRMPALPLGRLRAQRALTEIRTSDLAMTRGEAVALMESCGVRLSHGRHDALVTRTLGWPAALYLTALSLRDRSDPTAAADGLQGDNELVAAYLRDEVLAPLPSDHAAFLVRASILDPVSGPACDAVMGRCDSARILAQIADDNLLLAPVGPHACTYRWHPLLRQVLAGQMHRLDPAAERDLHEAACGWYLGEGDRERATDHAIAAGDVSRAAGLVWDSVPSYIARGRNGDLKRRLRSFRAHQLSAHAPLALAAATSDLVGGDLEGVQRWEAAALCALDAEPAAEPARELGAAAAVLGAAAADGVASMGEQARRGCSIASRHSPWRALGRLLEGVSLHLTGDGPAAETCLEDGARLSAVVAPTVQALCLAQLTLLAAERDDWDAAAATASRARAQVEFPGLGDYPTSALVLATSALVRSRRGMTDQASDDIRRATGSLSLLGDFIPWYDAETRIALAEAMLRTGDVAGARGLATAAAQAARRVPDATALATWVGDLQADVDAAVAAAALGPLALTTAEMRIIGFLPTHLSFREIAGRLYVSANTVKTQAHSVYRKLGASSRSEAVSRAAELGLLAGA